MIHKKLNKAPLQEVVFELRWEGKIENSNLFDEGYDLAVGILHHKLKESFPIHKKIYQDSVTVFGLPMHQYWKGEQNWPVVQHGPCILAINDIEENYIWEESFKPLIFKSINNLKESYSVSLNFNQLSLQYIDAFKNLKDIVEFTKENFNINLETSIEGFTTTDQFSYYKNFILNSNSVLHLTLATANTSTVEPSFDSLMITINYIYTGEFTFDNIDEIIEDAHNSTSLFFKKLLKKEYYASLV
jgi:uncharacterized protein (TIGR04255 family)